MTEIVTVTIPKTEYEDLMERSEWLSDLEQHDVDNWQGIDYAIALLRERKENLDD